MIGSQHPDASPGGELNKPAAARTRTEKQAPATRSKVRGLLGVMWRTRGLWFGLIAIGIAMYAQKLTTVDRQIIPSIHWYALAIAVLLVGWLGTYVNRSFLVVPLRQEKKKQAQSVLD